MKAVLLAVQPKYCELIASGKKTVDVRKSKPNLRTPFNCYIYMTKNGNKSIEIVENERGVVCLQKDFKMVGKVIGEFMCDSIDKIAVYNEQIYAVEHFQKGILQQSCLSLEEIKEYLGIKNEGYAWHISNLKIYDKSKELSEFVRRGYLDCDKCAHVPPGMPPAEFVWHNKFCEECNELTYKHRSMKFTHFRKRLSHPPQSWCYIDINNYHGVM